VHLNGETYTKEKNNLDILHLKKIIYDLETPKINSLDFENLFLDVSDILAVCKKEDSNVTRQDVESLLLELWKNAEILKFSGVSTEGSKKIEFSEAFNRKIDMTSPKRIRSRVAEIIRQLYYLRNRFDFLRSISTFAYENKWKKIPRWEVPVETVIDELLNEVDNGFEVEQSGIKKHYKYSLANKNHFVESIRIVLESFNDLFGTSGHTAHLSKFQVEGLKEVLRIKHAFERVSNKRRYHPKNIVLTAGVGSGKTFAFILPILIETLYLKLQGQKGIQSIILYPRKALVLDQKVNIDKLINKINQKLRSLHLSCTFEPILMEGDSRIKDKALKAFLKKDPNNRRRDISVREAIQIEYREKNNDIVMATLESFKRRLINPVSCNPLVQNVKVMVFDEIHLMDGIQGCHSIHLVRRFHNLWNRLNPTSNDEVLFIGSSATVAEPEEHAAKIFSVSRKNIKRIFPKEEDLENVGIVHHLFLKQKRGVPAMSTLTNLVSALLHNRRNGMARENSKDPVSLEKTLGFVDSLDILGRWRDTVKDNEGCLGRYFGKDDPPYFTFFFEPMHTQPKTNKDYPIKTNYCKVCKQGVCVKIPGNFSVSDFRKFIIEKRKLVEFSEIRKEDLDDLGTLDKCPYFKYGYCWWFSQDDYTREPLLGKLGFEVYINQIHPGMITSKVRNDSGDVNMMFQNTAEEIFEYSRLSGWGDFKSEMLNINLLMTSPVLEVGVDIKNVKDAITYKAIRNVSSYRQKVGRVGREVGPSSDSLICTLLSLRPQDFHYYRRLYKLMNNYYLDPIPLKPDNLDVIKSHVFMACMDFLAWKYNEYGFLDIYNVYDFTSLFKDRVQFARDYVVKNRDELESFLAEIAYNDESIVREAIETFIDNLNILLLDTSEAFPGTSNLADILSKRNRITPSDIYNQFLASIRKILKNLDEIKYYEEKIRTSGMGSAIDGIQLALKYVEEGKLEELESHISKLVQSFANISQMLNILLSNEKLNVIGPYTSAFSELQILLNNAKGNPSIFSLLQIASLINQFNGISSENRFLVLSYLDNVFSYFQKFRNKTPFILPAVFFEDPHEKVIELILAKQTESETLSASLFSYLPGMWSHRIGRRVKAITNNVSIDQHGLATVSLLGKNIGTFREIARLLSSDIPTDYPIQYRGRQMIVYEPQKIKLMYVPSMYNHVDPTNSLVRDGDDFPSKGHTTEGVPITQLPRTRSLNWYKITHFPESDKDIEPRILIAGKKLKIPPVFSLIFSSVKFTEKLNVVEYVYGIDRQYATQKVEGIRILYREKDTLPTPAALGRKFQTDGIIFKVNKEIVEEALTSLFSSTDSFSRSVRKQLLFQALYEYLRSNLHLNPFDVNLLRKAITWGCLDCAQGDLSKIDVDFVSHILCKIQPEELSAILDLIGKVQDRRILSKSRIIKEFAEGKATICDKPFDVDFVRSNSRLILLHSIAHHLRNAGARLLGANDTDLRYFLSIENGEIYLFDGASFGNGICESISKFMYISDLCRIIEARINPTKDYSVLPTSDFTSSFEEELCECEGSTGSYIALALADNGIQYSDNVDLGLFEYLRNEVEFEFNSGLIDVYLDIKKKFPMFHHEDLIVLQIIPEYFLPHSSIQSLDQFEKIVSICVTNCCECLNDSMACVFGPLVSSEKLNKDLVSFFYRFCAFKNPEYYEIISPDKLYKIHAKVGKNLGGKSIEIEESVAGTTQKRVIFPIVKNDLIGHFFKFKMKINKARRYVSGDIMVKSSETEWY